MNTDNSLSNVVVSISGSTKRRKRRQFIARPDISHDSELTIDGFRLALTWTVPVSLFLHGYRLFRNGSLIRDTTDNTFIEILTSSGSYEYELEAYNHYGGVSPRTSTTFIVP